MAVGAVVGVETACVVAQLAQIVVVMLIEPSFADLLAGSLAGMEAEAVEKYCPWADS